MFKTYLYIVSVKKWKLEKITIYHILAIISLLHVETNAWFWSDGSHMQEINLKYLCKTSNKGRQQTAFQLCSHQKNQSIHLPPVELDRQLIKKWHSRRALQRHWFLNFWIGTECRKVPLLNWSPMNRITSHDASNESWTSRRRSRWHLVFGSAIKLTYMQSCIWCLHNTCALILSLLKSEMHNTRPASQIWPTNLLYLVLAGG